jgi:hypothetical protein
MLNGHQERLHHLWRFDHPSVSYVCSGFPLTQCALNEYLCPGGCGQTVELVHLMNFERMLGLPAQISFDLQRILDALSAGKEKYGLRNSE